MSANHDSPEEPAAVHQDETNDTFYGLRSDNLLTVDELVKRYIRFALKTNNGIKEKTAQVLDIDRKTLYRKIQEMDSSMKMSQERH